MKNSKLNKCKNGSTSSLQNANTTEKLSDMKVENSTSTKLSGFESLDYGTRPTTARFETIRVELNLELMVDDYGKAYHNELHRRNPLRLESTNLSDETLARYFKTLLAYRVKQVEGGFKLWRQAKVLYIPTWIQFVMSCIGKIQVPDFGIAVEPVLSEKDKQLTDDDSLFNIVDEGENTNEAGFLTFSQMLDVSRELQAFQRDGVSLVKDAFPRSIEGDFDVMSMAIIEGYVSGRIVTDLPIATYVASFVGLRLQNEMEYKSLYRVRYDDVEFIRQMLLSGDDII